MKTFNISKVTLKSIKSKLKNAIECFKESQSEWGLGLSYNLLGRLYRPKNFSRAQECLRKAIENFGKIDHYRGIFLSLKDLHDL
jgi:hypothetical protein